MQKYCHYWWLVAPEGVVRDGELPERWGLYEAVDDKKKPLRLVKPAPLLEPAPPDARFVASVLRNAFRAQDRLAREAHTRGYAEAREELKTSDEQGPDKLLALERELGKVTRELEWKTRNVAELEQERRQFARDAGLPENALSTRGEQRHIAAQFKLAGVLALYPPARLAEVLRECADKLGELAEISTMRAG